MLATSIAALTTSTPAVQEYQTAKSDRAIDPVHFDEWVKGSLVAPEITRLSIESLSSPELNERIKPKNPIQSGGWWCSGVNWRTGLPMGNRYGQGKPDQPHDLEDGKKAKYLTASGLEPDAIFLPLPDRDYWLNLYSDKTQTRYWTEGAKKAGCGLTIGLPTIALTGVWNWGKDGQLAADVKRWAQPGTHHIICFDSDYASKPECRAAIATFARLLLAEGVASVKVAVWDTQWKGLDDFIAANGGDAFKEVLLNSVMVERWEKQFKPTRKDKGDKPPTPKAIAERLYEKLRENWRYHLQQRCWRIWNGQTWERRDDEVVCQLLQAQLDSMDVDYPNPAFIENVIKLLKWSLLVETWENFDRSQFIAGTNGILNVESRQVEPHKPGYGFTSILPHEVRPFAIAQDEREILQQLEADCPEVSHFFSQSMLGDPIKVLKLIAAVNAVVRFRLSKLQRFLHLIGEPGTGKGTFLRLIKAVVGSENYKPASLTNLQDGSTMARIIDAQVAAFPDERRQVGVEWLLKLTGGDDIDYREVYAKAASSPFNGSVIVASNTPVFAGDTTGLDRRLWLIPFEYVVPEQQRDPDLQDRLNAEVPELVSVALSMPDSLVDDLICGRGIGRMPEIRWHEWQMKLQTDKVAAFIDEMLVPQEGWDTGASDLFKAYLEWAKESNHSTPGSQTFFGSRLANHLNWLGWQWKKAKSNGTQQYSGFRLRDTQGQFYSDQSTPTPSECLAKGTNYPSGTVELSLGTVPGTVSNPVVERDRDSRDSSAETFYASENLTQSPLSEDSPKKFVPETIPTIPMPEPERDRELSLNSPQGQSEPSLKKDGGEIQLGDRVRYQGKNEELQQFKRVTMVVKGIATKAPKAECDFLTCELPGGATRDFQRYTLRKLS